MDLGCIPKRFSAAPTLCSTNEDGAGLSRRRCYLLRPRQKLGVYRAATCRATASFAVNDVGGDVFFYMCPPRFVNAGRRVPARVTPRAAAQSTIESSRSVFSAIFFFRFLRALFVCRC